MEKRKKILPPNIIEISDTRIKLVIISPSNIEEYKLIISQKLNDLNILYSSNYEYVIEFIRHNSNRVFNIITPNFFFDSVNKKANDLAKEVKEINSNNRVFCYSEEYPEFTNRLNLVLTDFKTREDEIEVIMDLLK